MLSSPTVCKAGSCNEQVEEFDSEIESLQSNVKRKQKPPPRLAHLEESVNRHKTHIGRLEQIIRLLDNDALHPDELSQVVNEEIQEYIDRNQEDFDAYEVGHMQLSNWSACCLLLHFSCTHAVHTVASHAESKLRLQKADWRSDSVYAHDTWLTVH